MNKLFKKIKNLFTKKSKDEQILFPVPRNWKMADILTEYENAQEDYIPITWRNNGNIVLTHQHWQLLCAEKRARVKAKRDVWNKAVDKVMNKQVAAEFKMFADIYYNL